jgi:nucleoside-diphosphate-sugar epimerase
VKILVTGANGFVGRALVAHFLDLGHTVRATGRASQVKQGGPVSRPGFEYVGGYDFDVDANWMPVLAGVDVIVHAAARVHHADAGHASALPAFRQVNTRATLDLARQAQQAGVRRFVFISSVKVLGESTAPGAAFRADDRPRPIDGYGISKHEAEQGLLGMAQSGGMEVTIIRPPLVYGPGVRANFRSMMKWLGVGIPLPLGRITNRRSLVGLGNLVDLIGVCLDHPGARNQVFMAADGADLSTPELLRHTARALGREARLLPVPVSWLRLGASLFGKQDMLQRLCESLQVDIEKNRQLLGWTPPNTVDQELARTAAAFLREASQP